MPLPTYATMDEVPEDIRDAYTVADGKAVPKLVVTLAKERAEREAAAKALKDAEKRLADIESELKAKRDGITDEQVAKYRAEFEAKLAPERQAREAAEARLRAMQLDAAVKSVMSTSGVRAERIDTLWRLEGEQFDLSSDGSPIVKDRPATTVQEAVAGLVTKYPEFFAAPPASGSGAMPSRGVPAGGQDLSALVLTNPRALLDMENMKGVKAA